jgi:hypothetical protein
MGIKQRFQDLKDIKAGALSDKELIANTLLSGSAGMDAESCGNKLSAQTAVLAGKGELKFGSQFSKIDTEGETVIGGMPTVNFDTENFDNADPEAVMAINFEVNASEQVQDPSVEEFFPTIEVDPAVAALKVTLSTTYLQNSRKRLIGAPALESTPLITAMFDLNGPLGKNELNLVPVVMDGGHIVTEFKKSVVHPETGETIETGPFELGVAVDVIAESQTDVMLTDGVFDEKTILATLPTVESVAVETTSKDADGNDVTDYVNLDVSGLEGVVWKDGVTGREQSIELKINGSKRFNLAQLSAYDGSETKGLSNLSVDYSVEINFLVDGEGSLQAPLTARVSGVQLVGVYDAAGKLVANDANDDVTAIVAAVNSISPKGINYALFIPNKALEKDGSYLVSKTYTKILEIVPMKPQSIESTILKGITINDNLDINNLIAYTYSIATVAGLITLDKSIAKWKTDIAGNVPLSATGITFPLVELVDAYFTSEEFRVKDMMDSVESGTKRDALKSAFEDFIGIRFENMTLVTGYGRVANEAKIAYKPSLMVPPALIAAIGNTVTINGQEVKMVSNVAKEFRDRVICAISTVDNSEKTAPYRFGTFVKSPALVGERVTNSVAKVTVVPYGKHHVTLPISFEITMPDIEAYADKDIKLMRVIA